MFVLRTNHTFVLRINLVVLRITTRGVLSVIFDSLQVSIDPRHARCPNLNPFDPGRFPYFPDDGSRCSGMEGVQQEMLWSGSEVN